MNSLVEKVKNCHRQLLAGSLTAEEVPMALSDAVSTLTDNADPTHRTALEQAQARMDFILWGVCEQERDAHILELFRELEAKLTE